MIPFKDFFKKDKSEMKARHMHAVGRDPNSRKKYPGRFVPKMHQVKQENPKLTRMKKGLSRREILASWDVKQITRQFNTSPTVDKPKKLGNTGILMKYDERYKKFILIKESSENIPLIPSNIIYYDEDSETWSTDIENVRNYKPFRWNYKGAKVKFKDKEGNLYFGEIGTIRNGSVNQWACIDKVVKIGKVKNKKDQGTVGKLLDI